MHSSVSLERQMEVGTYRTATAGCASLGARPAGFANEPGCRQGIAALLLRRLAMLAGLSLQS
jgi:hypothetical protein